MDFYDDEALSAAKQQLLKDFNSIRLRVEMDSVPHIPQRREGVNRAQREVDDMFVMLNALDERLLLSNLLMFLVLALWRVGDNR